MRLTMMTALLAGAGAAWLFTAEPVQAQQSGVNNRPSRVITYGRPRTRVTVQRRSYLDPGREVQPYSQTYTDYVFLNRRPLDILGPGQSNDRQPFPHAWEPGGSWRN